MPYRDGESNIGDQNYYGNQIVRLEILEGRKHIKMSQAFYCVISCASLEVEIMSRKWKLRGPDIKQNSQQFHNTKEIEIEGQGPRG